MSKIKKITLAYILAAVILEFLEITALVTFSFSITKHNYSFGDFSFVILLILFLLNLIPLSIFYWLGFIGIKNKNIFLQSFSNGIIFWIYIFVIPFFSVQMLRLGFFNEKMEIAYLFALVQFIIGGYLIFRFKLPKALAILAFLLPGLSNLYFLIYGMYKNESNKTLES